MTECLENKLPEKWYRDRAAILIEVDAHGTLAAAAEAHGVSPRTARDGWKSLGLPKLPGPKTQMRPIVLDAGISREELLEAEVKELRALLKRQRAADVGEERIIHLLAEMLPAKEPIYSPAPTVVKLHDSFTPHEHLLLWSDLHAAEKVSLEQMNGINEYDWAIMMRRHDTIIKAIRSFKTNRPYPVHRLQIAALGDMVTGDIHEELAETNEMVLMEAALQLGLDGAEFIEALVPEYEVIDLAGVVGNHGRRSKKPKAKNAFDNFDWMVYHIMRLRLAKYTSVRFTIPKAAQHPIRMCGRFTCLMFHGDGIRSTMPGVPWGGIARRTRELDRQFQPVIGTIDHFLCGHFHQWNVTDGGRVIMNGSIKGPDEYSIKQFGGGCDPTQLLLTFHPRKGLTDVSRLDLTTGRAEVVPLRALA